MPASRTSRKKTCYRYPWSTTAKARATKKRPTAKRCARKVVGASYYRADYNRWDVATGRPQRRGTGTTLRSIRTTKPGTRAGQYRRTPTVRMSVAALDREIKRLMAQRRRRQRRG